MIMETEAKPKAVNKKRPLNPIMRARKRLTRLRLLIQSVFAIVTNSYFIGFIRGTIYTGPIKQVCVPGLNCYSCPGARGACPIGALQSVFNQSDWSKEVWVDGKTGFVVTKPLYYFSFYVIGFLMMFGALCGRLICGFLCPFGLVQDLLHKIPLPKKLKIQPNFKGDKLLRKLKYVVLILMVIILPLLYAPDPFFCKYICPSGMLLGGIPLMTIGSSIGTVADGTGTAITSWAEAGAITWLKISILAATVILSIMIYRPFCKYICPLGAIYALFNKISLYRFSIDEEKCTDCGVCAKVCKMGVDVHKTPNHTECIRCGDCKAACPHHAICSGFGKVKRTANVITEAEKYGQ